MRIPTNGLDARKALLMQFRAPHSSFTNFRRDIPAGKTIMKLFCLFARLLNFINDLTDRSAANKNFSNRTQKLLHT